MRGDRISAGILCLIVFVFCARAETAIGDNFNEPVPLEDGILVTNNGNLKSLAAIWSTVVVLDSPQPEPDLVDRLERFRNTINRLHDLVPTFNATKNAWNIRISSIESSISSPGQRAHRTRRGLFDFIGDASNFLFGTASQAQVDECRREIEKASAFNQRVVHSYNSLLTVVNQTRDQLLTNRNHILSIEEYVSKLQNQVNDIERAINESQHQTGLTYAKLIRNTKVNRILSAIEASHGVWLRQHDLYQRQRASLELGWITEEILTPAELRTILTKARAAGFHTPRLEWIYSHVAIKPYWEQSDKIVFVAEIPLTTDANYLRYRIRTWPVPGNDTDYTIEIMSPEDVALDTRTGGIFEPHSCLGKEPAICRTGPVFGAGRLTCPRGIINGDPKQRRGCVARLRKHSDATTRAVEEFVPGHFAITSTGEDYYVYCPTRREERRQLSSGVFVVRVQPGCRISGADWTIYGYERWNSSVTVTLEVVAIVPMDIGGVLPRHMTLPHMNKPNWEQFDEIKDLPMEQLSMDTSGYVEPIEWGSHSGHISWILIIVVCIICGAMVYVGIILCKKQMVCAKLTGFGKQKRERVVVENDVVKSVDGQPQVIPRLYPQVPSTWAALIESKPFDSIVVPPCTHEPMDCSE